MKAPHSAPTAQRDRAFTLLELLAIIITTAVLAGLLLPAVGRPKRYGTRINCVSNLKQIGLAFRMWSNEHQEKFPWLVSTNEGGTLEFAQQGGVLFHFRAISNELTTPKVLVCSTDRSRSRATSFLPSTPNAPGIHLNSAAKQISYFVGLDASETRPQSILSGDRNLAGGTRSAEGLLSVTPEDRLAFNTELHNGQGNVGLGDGSAHQFTSVWLNRQIEAAFPTNQNRLRLALPQ